MTRFYGEELLAPRQTLKLEDHPLSTVRDCLFNMFTATLHIVSRSSIRNLTKRLAGVTGPQVSWPWRRYESETSFYQHGLHSTYCVLKEKKLRLRDVLWLWWTGMHIHQLEHKLQGRRHNVSAVTSFAAVLCTFWNMKLKKWLLLNASIITLLWQIANIFLMLMCGVAGPSGCAV
jgi:hypothetical protein